MILPFVLKAARLIRRLQNLIASELCASRCFLLLVFLLAAG